MIVYCQCSTCKHNKPVTSGPIDPNDPGKLYTMHGKCGRESITIGDYQASIRPVVMLDVKACCGNFEEKA